MYVVTIPAPTFSIHSSHTSTCILFNRTLSSDDINLKRSGVGGYQDGLPLLAGKLVEQEEIPYPPVCTKVRTYYLCLLLFASSTDPRL